MVKDPSASVCVAELLPFTCTVAKARAESPEVTLPVTGFVWLKAIKERNKSGRK
jgi:hypothetical protein